MKFSIISTLYFSPILLASLTSSETFTPGTEALYYGFFFDPLVASSIKNITDTYFTSCLKKIPAFKAFVDSLTNLPDAKDYFIKPLDPNTEQLDEEYHVTAKYCGEEDCSQYRSMVEKAINQKFEMHLIGYVMTNRTFGVRVKLTSEQDQLFDNDETTLQLGLDLKEILPGIRLENQTLDFNPTTNKPHITLGCAKDIPAVTTGTDLLEIISYEKNMTEYSKEIFLIDMKDLGEATELKNTIATVVHYFGEYGDAFVIYPSVKVLATATFKPYLKPDVSFAMIHGSPTFTALILLSVVLNYFILD